MANASMPAATDVDEIQTVSFARGKELVDSVIREAKASGLLDGPEVRLDLGISKALLEKAKLRTGLASDRELLEYVLADFALEDNFAEAFRNLAGTADLDLDLGY